MKDPKTESYLKMNGYGFVFHKSLALSSIDMKEAEENPARLMRRLDEDRAISYGMAMEEGADFPGIVVLDIGDGLPKRLITGMHRCKAADTVGLKNLDAYIVREADPYRIELLLRTINNIEGKAPDLKEKLSHIAEMRRQFPHATLEELAKRFQVHVATVRNYVKEIEAERRANELGLGTAFSTQRFPQKLKVALHAIQNDNTFRAAVNLIANHPDLRGSAAISLAKELKEITTEKRALKIVEDRDRELTSEEEDKKARKSKSPTGTATQFVSRVRSVLRFYPGTVDKLYLAGLPTAQIQREKRLMDEVIGILSDVRDAMAQMEQEQERALEWRTPRGGHSYAPSSLSA